jgi:EAL domain-containing protein (putative c-di-GMP-specific phosphodiesterase class I)
MSIEEKLLTIDDVIDQQLFYHHFQPIWDIINWKILGYKILLRSESKNFEDLVHRSVKNYVLYQLNTASIMRAISLSSKALGSISNKLLFINILPSTITHQSFLDFIEEIIKKTAIYKQIVFEINEFELTTNFDLLYQVITTLRKKGFRIAVDDFWKGSMGLRNMLELEVDFVKFDKYFSQKLSVSPKKQKFIELVHNFCKENNSQVIIEGIEYPSDLAILKILGIPYAQGFLLGKPIPI